MEVFVLENPSPQPSAARMGLRTEVFASKLHGVARKKDAPLLNLKKGE
jgi:hypothetical protein